MQAPLQSASGQLQRQNLPPRCDRRDAPAGWQPVQQMRAEYRRQNLSAVQDSMLAITCIHPCTDNNASRLGPCSMPDMKDAGQDACSSAAADSTGKQLEGWLCKINNNSRRASRSWVQGRKGNGGSRNLHSMCQSDILCVREMSTLAWPD